jgi:AcrR family transcriptional regulator
MFARDSANSTHVAECGGVSIGTLYQHYPKKQSLLFISTAGAAPITVRKLREHLELFFGRHDTISRFFTRSKAAT